MIVVDSNVITYLFIAGEHTEDAQRALEHDLEWAAPRLWRSEFMNVLAKYLRLRYLDLSEASQIMGKAEALMAGNDFEVSSKETLRLVSKSGCSAYDCEFVALAQDLGVALVTSDKQILTSFPSIAVSLKAFGKE